MAHAFGLDAHYPWQNAERNNGLWGWSPDLGGVQAYQPLKPQHPKQRCPCASQMQISIIGSDPNLPLTQVIVTPTWRSTREPGHRPASTSTRRLFFSHSISHVVCSPFIPVIWPDNFRPLQWSNSANERWTDHCSFRLHVPSFASREGSRSGHRHCQCAIMEAVC